MAAARNTDDEFKDADLDPATVNYLIKSRKLCLEKQQSQNCKLPIVLFNFFLIDHPDPTPIRVDLIPEALSGLSDLNIRQIESERMNRNREDSVVPYQDRLSSHVNDRLGDFDVTPDHISSAGHQNKPIAKIL